MRNLLVLSALALCHSAPVDSDSDVTGRTHLDESGFEESGGETGSDGAQCPDPNKQYPLPFPLPDPTQMSHAFDHYLHCKQAVNAPQPADMSARMGAVITYQEHLDHCQGIVDTGSRAIKRQGETSFNIRPSNSFCSMLGFDSGILLCPPVVGYSYMLSVGVIDNMNVCPMDLWNGRYDTMPAQGIDALPAQGIARDITLEEDFIDGKNEAGGLVRIHAPADLTQLPDDCKLTREYYQLSMGLNHETLVARSSRNPGSLTAAENAYLDEWTSDRLGDQYAIAEQCTSLDGVFVNLPGSGLDCPIPCCSRSSDCEGSIFPECPIGCR